MNQLRIIYFAIFLSTFIYLAVAWSALHAIPPKLPLAEMLQSPLVIAMYGAALTTYVAAFFVGAAVGRRDRRSGYIARLAMLEAVCILGLIVAFVTQDWRLYLPPWVFTFIGFARSLPRDDWA